MVTMLSPKRIVSTVMGAWFLALAFSGYLAGVIAGFTGVGHGAGGPNGIPAPIETVGIYGEVFGKIAIAAIISAGSLFALAPLLNRWTHSDTQSPTD
jgi:POT family proton-dependent oligopeptide transporter